MYKISSGVIGLFLCNVRTRQRGVTSTTIFSLFINKFLVSSLFKGKCESGILINNEKPDIICLLYADDVANCAEIVFKL